MSKSQIRVIRIDPFQQRVVPMKLEGANLYRAVCRSLKAGQLGWKELCKIEDRRLMGSRPAKRGGTESFDAGPTPLIVAADAAAEPDQPGFRLRGGTSTAGLAMLFGQGIGGGMVNCPVDAEWLKRHLVWLTAEEAVADEVGGETVEVTGE